MRYPEQFLFHSFHQTNNKFLSHLKYLKSKCNLRLQAGASHTVTIEVEGTPAPELTFYKDGVEIKSSERIVITKESEYIYKITIKETKLTDTGSYSVIAK